MTREKILYGIMFACLAIGIGTSIWFLIYLTNLSSH